MTKQLLRLDDQATAWMARNGVSWLRVSLGVVFLWFGALKLFPGLSPAENLVGRTILALTLGGVGPELSVPILGTWEALIGLGLITGRALRLTLILLFAQMAGTITPLALFPDEAFTRFPHALTMEGQYIVKNAVLISAAMVVGGTFRASSRPGLRY